MSGDNLSIALQRLTLGDVWGLAPRPDSPPMRAGVVKVNPLREDRNPSFSVTGDFKVFKDHAREDVKGGVWQFVQLCRPEWDKKTIARYLIAKAGLDPDEGAPAPRARREVRAAREWQGSPGARMERARREEKSASSWAPWPEGVRARWEEGLRWLEVDGARREKIAAKRGWPVAVVDELVALGVIAYPRLPWTDAKRGTAFLVQVPQKAANGVTLVSVGYHQRWWRDARDGRPAEKSWLFLPSEKPVEERREWPVEFAPQRTSPFPFVLGDVASPRLVVVLEGQWDAITFFHAAGWLITDAFPGGVCVVGVRGNQGAAPFFEAYGKLWAGLPVKPAAWVIRDGDKAGETWDVPSSWLPGQTFVERLRAMTSRVLVSRLRDGAGLGKDFNDYWKLKRPGASEIAGMLQRLGLNF